MAIFSNLEGTMQPTFIIGKNGAKIITDGKFIQVQDYAGNNLLPISAGEPKDNTHLVTLGYFNTHSGGGSGNILRGTNAPDPMMGNDGDLYFQVDATNITEIFIKDLGMWKPYMGTSPTMDSDYVTSFTIPVTDFVLKPGTSDEYEYIIGATTHDRGNNVIIELQGEPDDKQIDPTLLQTEVSITGFGDITVTMLGMPTEYEAIKVNIIGATKMTTPYGKTFNQTDWMSVNDKYTYTVDATTHGQNIDNLYVVIYANEVPGATAMAPFDLVTTEAAIDSSGNVTFTSDEAFSGKVVISGK